MNRITDLFLATTLGLLSLILMGLFVYLMPELLQGNWRVWLLATVVIGGSLVLLYQAMIAWYEYRGYAAAVEIARKLFKLVIITTAYILSSFICATSLLLFLFTGKLPGAVSGLMGGVAAVAFFAWGKSSYRQWQRIRNQSVQISDVSCPDDE